MAGEVTVKISPDGSKVEMDAEGFTGGKCEDLMGSTIKMLGIVSEDKRKPEFYLTGGSGIKQGS